MKSYDASQLATALNGLAEAYDRKPLAAKALEIWFETLKEFPSHLVFGILGNWAKLHTKFPVPGEVWKLCNDIQIAEREKTAAKERAETREPVRFAPTDAGTRALAEMRKLLEDHPKPSPIEHWHRVLSTFRPGTPSHDHATAALKILQRRARHERQPGEDEQEAA